MTAIIDLAIAILAAISGQILLTHHDAKGLILYALAVLMLLLPSWRDARFSLALPRPARITPSSLLPGSGYGQLWRLLLLPVALSSTLLTFITSGDNAYHWYNVVPWLLSVGAFLVIFWERDHWPRLRPSQQGIRLSWATLALLALMLIGIWFRFWRLAELPPEMTSDHVEKLLDVHDLVTGQRPIFFVRNTGREPWQFYWTFMFIRMFDLQTKYFALKLGTAIVGLLTLPGVYLLGRELFGRWAGLWATLFTAVASWPVILSRVGLRFPFAPAASVWSLLYLLRGLRDGRRNDFLLLGLWLGIGLHGYTAFRVMPLAVVVCWGLALIFNPRSLSLPRAVLVRNALLTILIATVVFMPLGRFALQHPEDFWGRAGSRLADPNQPIPDGPFITLAKNLVDLALMFNWRGDSVWVNTLADAPVLDPILGGLFILGLVLTLWAGWRQRNAIPPLLLITGALLLLPSALSLAYPIENPSVVRTGGAIPVVMLVAALPVGLGIEYGLKTLRGWPRWALALGALSLAVAVTWVNHRRYFDRYQKQYRRYAINTTEIAASIQGFAESGGDLENAWIVAWPYWIDTRGAGIALGDPTWNNVILEPETLQEHATAPRPRFYVLHPQDKEALRSLQHIFPAGWSSLYQAQRVQHDFVRFYVPPFDPTTTCRPDARPVSFSTAPRSGPNCQKGLACDAP